MGNTINNKENFEEYVNKGEEIPIEFSIGYGRIEVIWIDKNNNVIDKPLVPVLNGMRPIKWNGKEEEETTENDIEWYSYNAAIGMEDNITSKWANAKNLDDGSYFVWIPRYAYRITYYADEKSTEPIGYCDGRGIEDINENVKYPLDEGVQTVEKDGKNYIVHPAFETNLNLGGWTEELSGIWVAKFVMSQELISNDEKRKFRAVSKPNLNMWRDMSVGANYLNSLKYDENKKSHLMKNSEWGAVAYLTHSQYGSNGYEICGRGESYITGNVFVSGMHFEDNKERHYEYNTVTGQQLSSTGNIYGIYDLVLKSSGECVAVFNNKSTSKNIIFGEEFASLNGKSTEYATAYSNEEENYEGIKIYEIGKTGDATKEIADIYTGKACWYKDHIEFINNSYPFLSRGLFGIFTSLISSGKAKEDPRFSSGDNAFRVILPGV